MRCCIKPERRLPGTAVSDGVEMRGAPIGLGWGRKPPMPGALARSLRAGNSVQIVAVLHRHVVAKRRPRRMRRTGHIRERSPGSFELRYSLRTDPATGKRRVATTTVRGSRKDAEKELRRLLHLLDTNEHVDPTRITVRQWLTTWLETIREEVAARTHERYAEIVNNFLVPALGNLPIVKLAPHIFR